MICVQGEQSLMRLAAQLDRPLPGIGRAGLVRVLRPGNDSPADADEHRLLDEALALRRGKTWVEICLHGNALLVSEFMAAMEGPEGTIEAARVQTPEQVAWDRLSEIRSPWGARVVLDQAQGALTREVAAWARGDLRLDESWLQRFEEVSALLHPPLVVLAGATNAGKSTLFNLLVGEDRVLVSSEAGTTRDTVHAWAGLGDWVVQLVDTAGVRELGGSDTEDPERQGQQLGEELRRRADWVLELVAVGDERLIGKAGEARAARTSYLASRADDLFVNGGDPTMAISVHSAPEHARRLVTKTLLQALGLTSGTGPSGGPWCAGRGVPLDRELAEQLDGLAHHPEGEIREQEALEYLARWAGEAGAAACGGELGTR